VRLSNPSCEAWEQKIALGPEQTLPLRARLAWKPALIKVFATPADATVMVEDGNSHNPLGTRLNALATQADPIRVPTGDEPRRRVRVRVFKQGFREQVEELSVQANTPAEVKVVLAAQ
jgi:hypothetical protein